MVFMSGADAAKTNKSLGKDVEVTVPSGNVKLGQQVVNSHEAESTEPCNNVVKNNFQRPIKYH